MEDRDGNDMLRGSGGDDRLYGQESDDTLNGRSGKSGRPGTC
ncbi:MAG: hypothetical protein GDA53_06830 [Rhodobacteraceae bacterium]|nr:hypothetical protein [Paracoccaceae bacterium]